MNDRLLLVNVITLLFCSSQLEQQSDSFKSICRDIVLSIKSNDVVIGESVGVNVVSSLRKTAMQMLSDPQNTVYDADALLQRLKVDTGDDLELFNAFERGIIPGLGEDTYKKNSISIAHWLSTHSREKTVEKIINDAQYSLKFNRDKIQDFKTFVAEIYTKLEPHQSKDTHVKDPAIVSEILFNDKAKLANVFRSVETKQSGESLIKTGWQGLNRMIRAGFRRGDEIVIGALQHQYKSGFSLSLFKQFLIYNKPHMINPNKKPCMIRISFEDEIENNIEYLFLNLKQNETKRVEDYSKISPEEKAEYVMNKLKVQGYEVFMLRVDPTQWSYRDICNYCLEREAEGFEIHVLMLDYLAMVPTTGCTEGPTGSDIRDMYRRMRNFCSPRKITLVTPHQLSTDAKMMIREGKTNFVQELPGKGYYDKCKTVDNEVDMELFIHIEKVNGKSYLTVQRGKHRINGVTAAEYLYMALEFMEDGCILDDLNCPDSTLSKPGAKRVNGVEELPFWES